MRRGAETQRRGVISEWARLLVLGASAATALFVGGAVWLDPLGFYEAYGVALTEPSLRSELRGAAGLLVGAGALLAVGVGRRRLRRASAALGALVYLGYAVGRGLSLLLDGAPHPSLLQAGLVELALGLACGWVSWSGVTIPDAAAPVSVHSRTARSLS